MNCVNKEPDFTLDDFKIDVPEKTYPTYPTAPTIPKEPILEKAGLFNKKKVEEANALKVKIYEQQMATYRSEKERFDISVIKYNEECKLIEKEYSDLLKKSKITQKQKYEEALKLFNEKIEEKFLSLKTKLNEIENQKVAMKDNMAQMPTTSRKIGEVLDSEIQEAEELLKQLYQSRNQLYSYNVVFPKYRNIVAISSFYEYLMSGRCEELGGASGAYNIYEQECRANLVISQLTQIIESLEQIKENQFMMYQELKNINDNIARLNDKMSTAIDSIKKIENNTSMLESIASNTAVIAYNTERTAYYSKLNAQLTNSLGYMVAFK